jgi:hypothetical protein
MHFANPQHRNVSTTEHDLSALSPLPVMKKQQLHFSVKARSTALQNKV